MLTYKNLLLPLWFHQSMQQMASYRYLERIDTGHYYTQSNTLNADCTTLFSILQTRGNEEWPGNEEWHGNEEWGLTWEWEVTWEWGVRTDMGWGVTWKWATWESGLTWEWEWKFPLANHVVEIVFPSKEILRESAPNFTSLCHSYVE